MIKQSKKYKKKESRPISYLDKKLIETYWSSINPSYREKKLPAYKLLYPAVSANICSMHWDLLMASSRVLRTVYMQEMALLTKPEDLTLERQRQLIIILQNLPNETSFHAVAEKLNNLKGYTREYELDTLFDFLQASALFSEKKQIPSSVEKLLKVHAGRFSEEITQEHMNYISHMTRACIHDFIEDALDHFERLLPNADLTGIKDTRIRVSPAPEPKRISSKAVRFQFSENNGQTETTDKNTIIPTPSLLTFG
jgi:hypothetical protein